MNNSVRSCILFCSLALLSLSLQAQSTASATEPLTPAELDAVQARAQAQSKVWEEILSKQPPAELMREAEAMVKGGKEHVLQQIAGSAAPQHDMSDINTVVFISMSMPETTLKSLLNQGTGRADTIFVLRGWMPLNDASAAKPKPITGFQEIMNRLGTLIKDQEHPPTIMIHPYAFETYKVEHVPVVLHKRSTGVWKRLTGEISIDGAIEEIERGRTTAVGPVWKVAEPNILNIIEERARRYDWNLALKNARQRSLDRLFDGMEVPYAKSTSSTLFDPSVVVDRDYRGADGKIILARGTIINPLDKQPFSSAVIAIDPYDIGQLKLAKQWLQDNPNAIVFVTRNAVHADGRPTWEVLGIRTYPINELAMQRFGISSVPSLVKQFGRKMLVHTEATQ